ncbi:MAG: ATP-binding protein, partial [Bacteroidota bacterium]
AHDLLIKLDQAKVEKVLNNLLSNALKFSSAGDEILMEVKEQPGNLSIKIIDSGIGIAEQDLPHLFNRFYQADQPMEQLSGGTGIGLSLAKELANLHGGDILVESQQGMGSTFTLQLPFQEASKPSETVAEEEEQVNNPYLATTYQPFLLNGEKANVLIVEDNVEMNNFLQQILSPYFFCQSAMDGQQGLELLNKRKVDLIISDVMMPNMDGFTFREKVSEIDAFKDLPFIMLTARADDQDKIRGLQLGVNDYMPKPFNTQELIARIHNLLKNKQSRQAAILEAPAAEKEAVDERFVKEAEAIVLKHLDEVDFKVTDLAKALNYSQRQLARVLKKYTGLSPVEFILEIRLQKAYQLIQQQRYLSVSEIRYDVGIDSASYFSKKFTERFGETPSNLLKK